MDFPFVKEAISQLFSKPSCAMYPAVPSEAAPSYRGRIVYHADKCIGCGMCERVCAGNAISRTVEKTEEGDKITLTFNLGSCTFCATCADFCSCKAIELTGDYHMIATKEEDLLVTGSFIKKPPVKKAAPAPAAKPAAEAPAAPAEVYGHTGFTGTCAWVDPVNELVYVFLSNRIYPDVTNRKLNQLHIRERIQGAIYDAMKKK